MQVVKVKLAISKRLRELYQVDPVDYMLAICRNDALRELFSPGKSGSFFYLTRDDRFMIKTVKKSEVKVLIRMLPSYYRHMSRISFKLCGLMADKMGDMLPRVQA
ncbi:hypothetical protein ABKV19_004970 [Rosa sericea]